MSGRIIRRLEQAGATLFRINLSHTKLADLARTIDQIQSATSVPICLDTEGAQIRTGDIVGGSITLRGNSVVRAHRRRVPGDDRNFNFYPADITNRLEVGDFISIDFNSVLVQVIEIEQASVVMRVLNGGVVGQNKAVTVERPIDLAPLTEKDEASIKVGREMGLTHFALSFANSGDDVDYIRSLTGPDAFIISKIESRKALVDLESIGRRSDAMLIDRGDLSREVPIELIPRTQKAILRRGRALDTPVYVATNLLESMVVTPTPTRAEVNDIYNTLLDGADGLVLAAETAIGKYPIQCAEMIARLIKGYEKAPDHDTDIAVEPVSQLIEPHGGTLINQERISQERKNGADADLEALPSLTVNQHTLMDVEQIAVGTYSPLTGFMDRETLESVLRTSKLPSGDIWTLPIVLPVQDDIAAGIKAGDSVALRTSDGDIMALLDVSEIYEVDLEKFCQEFYGTSATDHPGVVRSLKSGRNFIGGKVSLIKPVPSPYRHYQLTPAQSRFIFNKLGWSQVVGFHGRNPAHRAHEAIQLAALEQSGADGLYINPVIGPKKKGDFLPDPIMKSYQMMLEFGIYPAGKVILGSFATYSRYGGPREAVFTALCRKNMGCSHFIIGRDHTGLGDFYPADANRRYFEELGDLGLTPIFFDAVGYNPESGALEPTASGDANSISGTEVREALKAGNRLPEWFMREAVQDLLLDEIASGRPVFHD